MSDPNPFAPPESYPERSADPPRRRRPEHTEGNTETPERRERRKHITYEKQLTNLALIVGIFSTLGAWQTFTTTFAWLVATQDESQATQDPGMAFLLDRGYDPQINIVILAMSTIGLSGIATGCFGIYALRPWSKQVVTVSWVGLLVLSPLMALLHGQWAPSQDQLVAWVVGLPFAIFFLRLLWRPAAEVILTDRWRYQILPRSRGVVGRSDWSFWILAISLYFVIPMLVLGVYYVVAWGPDLFASAF